MSKIALIGTRLFIVCGFLAVGMAFTATVVHAEGNAPLDVPAPVVTDAVEEWSVGSGLVYWAYNCFGDEFVTTAALKRKPAGGGIQRTLQSIDDGAQCNTYLGPLASSDGLYYLNDSAGQLERMPLGEPYTPSAVQPLDGNQRLGFHALVEDNGYLYWIGFQQIVRTLKDGSGTVEKVADTPSIVSDILVLGSTVYWIDNGGLKRISTNCATLPCTDTAGTLLPFNANTRGHGLVYQPPGGSGPIVALGFRLYWVENNTSAPFTYRIRTCSISEIVPCQDPVVLPGAVAAAASAAVGTFYTATPNWFIGDPILVNGNLYWTERDISTVNNSTGDVKRKANTTTEADPADTIATNQANIDSALYAANDTLFFARRNTGIYGLSLSASAITRDFEAGGMEITQAIQNLANSAPLVADKSTYVRAYGKQISGPSAPNVEARLSGTRAGNPLPGSPLAAINGARSLTTGGGYDRARLDDGWYFQLPASWMEAGPITLKFEIDGRRIHNDPNRANNELSQTVTIQQEPPACVWTVPVRTHTPLPSVFDPNVGSMVSHFTRRWPVPDTWIFRDTEPVEELQVCWAGIFPYPCYGPYELEDGWSITNGPPDRDKVIVSLWGRALLSFNPDACDDIGAPVHFMGMVHPDANNGGASGYASTVSNQSWVQLPKHIPAPIPAGWDQLRAGSVMAQELAHNEGRKHINCGDPDNIDSGYPYLPCQIANVGADSYYGFDTTTRQPIRPDQTADFMSYAGRTWVSDYTWRALMNSRLATDVVGAAAAGEGDSVFVTGLVDTENNRGAISTVLVLPTQSVPPSTLHGQARQASAPDHDGTAHAVFKLRLLDAVGTVLVERVQTLTSMDDHVADGASALFGDLFPQPAGQVAKIQLLADDTVIDEIQPGAASPTVAISQPTVGAVIDKPLTIAWTADDSDPDDQLLFTVQYSHDGGSKWHTIVINYPSTPDKSYVLTLDDLGGLQGSAPNQALIRVLASDGYNTTIATSSPFTVKNRAPEPQIFVPVADQTFPAGVAVALQGHATDPEEGGLSGQALVWTVDGNAAGSGSDSSVAGLAPGDHAVSLTATDSTNNVASADAGFTIAALSLAQATTSPVLDGSCDDPVYAGGAAISLKPYPDGGQATARLLRSDAYLWACFSGLKKGAESPGSSVGLRVDVDNSRSAQVQTSDYAFTVGEDGDVVTMSGDGSGGFTNVGPGGLLGQISSGADWWSTELRIDKANFNGWDHLIGLKLGHYWLESVDDDYVWPNLAIDGQPNTWAAAALGSQPLITALDPYTSTVNSAAFTLAVEGSGFVNGTTVLWGGNALPTTVIDEAHLTVDVGAAQLTAAGIIQLKTRTPGDFDSNALAFVVEAKKPVISSLSPASAGAGSPAITLVIQGSNFAPDAQVLWNGGPLATQFVSATQVKVSIGADLLKHGQTAGLVVRNQSPSTRSSDAIPFEVTPQQERSIYLPAIVR